ncbi:caspase family protein [Alphaproteobacteria bacterium]|nr:caspase family protein [Alphaproteobacteria bacterium]
MFKQSCQIIKSFSFLMGFIYLTVPTVTFSKDFNKFSKVTFSINNVISETIIGYYENYSTNPKRAFAKFNFNGDLCEAIVIIQNKSTFQFQCNSGYNGSGSYFASSKAINAMGKGQDSKTNEFMFRIHGNGTASRSDFLKSIDISTSNTIAKINNKSDKRITSISSPIQSKYITLNENKSDFYNWGIILSYLDECTHGKLGWHDKIWKIEMFLKHKKKNLYVKEINLGRQNNFTEKGVHYSQTRLRHTKFSTVVCNSNQVDIYYKGLIAFIDNTQTNNIVEAKVKNNKTINKKLTGNNVLYKSNTNNYSSLINYSNDLIISNACSYNGFKYTNFKSDIVSRQYVKEATRRGLDCGVKVNNQKVASSNLQIRVLNLNNKKLIQYACENGFWDTSYKLHIKEAKKRGLDCRFGNKKNYIASNNKSKTFTNPKTYKNFLALDAANKRTRELERKLAILESKQKQAQQRIDTDTKVPLLEIISNKTRGKRGTITGIARDNMKVAEVTIDGKLVSLSSNGNFKYSTYVPPTGKELKVQVTDIAGLTSSKIVTLKVDRTIADNSISFESLNPLGKRVRTNRDALALIVGVSNYENTKVKALYADNDAMVFKDYATEKLGISENRIKVLVNDGAEERDILLSVKEWLRRSAKPNKSDIYVFFAGHGLASQDGKNMYLLPHDGSPRLLEKTAILRDELFSDIKEANPKSVTVFLDTCYSGETRNEEMLIAGRPIVIRAKEQSIPSNFTVFSAAAGDQTSKPLEEAKHGMFSYYLMKGMEGDADTNSDNKIIAQELHNYVKENVTQQSSGSQTPELQGDKDRVLVQFN